MEGRGVDYDSPSFSASCFSMRFCCIFRYIGSERENTIVIALSLFTGAFGDSIVLDHYSLTSLSHCFALH